MTDGGRISFPQFGPRTDGHPYRVVSALSVAWAADKTDLSGLVRTP